MYQIDTRTIGMNAGKVWDVLQQDQALTKHQILNKTDLDSDKFHQAVGWLSRENKIRKDGEFYSISETNLTASIGSNAGVLVTVLDDLSESVEGLEQLTKIQPDEFQQAIGWLAREGHFQSAGVEEDMESDPLSTSEQMKRFQDEIEVLSDEIVSRNHIISELTRQLTETQTKYIQDIDIKEKLHAQLAKNSHLSSSVKDDEPMQKIQFFENEISDLHAELNSRNHIISELSRQLTSTQTTIITQADRLERLHSEMTKRNVASGSVSESLRHRLHRITQLQRSLDTTEDSALMTETTFYNDRKSPVLDIAQSQTVSDDELRHALHEIHQEIDDKIGQKKQQLHHDGHC